MGRDAFHSSRFATLLIGLIVGLCAALPLGWMLWQLISRPEVWTEFRPTAFRLDLLLRTLMYNLCAAALATALALPAAFVIGRGRGWIAGLLWIVLPVSLFVPSIVYSYGWTQFLRLLDCTPSFQSIGDVARCVWSLATWLLPIPAFIVGLALRSTDVDLQQQALLDGGYWRLTFRQLLGPVVASMLLCSVLAVQEFAVYEPTGISVIATEIRMVYDTGAMASTNNPIVGEISPLALDTEATREHRSRGAAALATALPMLALIGAAATAGWLLVRRSSAADVIDVGRFPTVLQAGRAAKTLSILILIVAMLLPLASLGLSLRGGFHPLRIVQQFASPVGGSIFVATVGAALAGVLAFAAVAGRSRTALIGGLITFLVGGQLVAIALIHLYNRPSLSGVYDSAAMPVLAYVGRFGWIALLAGRFTTSPRWLPLRQMAAIDGASALSTARLVIWPIAWPLLAAAALCVLTLSVTEVPATVLLSPQTPRMLTPEMMTWVHTLRYDPMIEASLLLVALVLLLAGSAAGLARLAIRFNRSPVTKRLPLLAMLMLPVLSACDQSASPDEVWLDTGVGPGRVVYPRAIAYDRASDTVYVVDRTARVQRLDRDGKALAEWALPESINGKPVGLSVGPDGNVYVPDTHYQRVIVYTPEGKEIRRWGSGGTGPGQFVYPTDIAFDAAGRIFVSEYGDNDRVQVFDQTGKFLYQFGSFGDGPGQFRRPQSMAVTGDTVYITDSCNHRIVVFKTDGTFLRAFGQTGKNPGEFRFPYGLEIDPKGKLIVTEFGNGRVQRIDPNTGASLGTWGRPGRELGELAYPWAAIVDRAGRVIAVDSGNNRLQVFRF